MVMTLFILVLVADFLVALLFTLRTKDGLIPKQKKK